MVQLQLLTVRTAQGFRGQVAGGTTEGSTVQLVVQKGGQTEVPQHILPLSAPSTNEDVLKLDVAVDHVVNPQIFHCLQQVTEHLHLLFMRVLLLPQQLLVKSATLEVLTHNVDALRGHVSFLECQDVVVV